MLRLFQLNPHLMSSRPTSKKDPITNTAEPYEPAALLNGSPVGSRECEWLLEDDDTLERVPHRILVVLFGFQNECDGLSDVQQKKVPTDYRSPQKSCLIEMAQKQAMPLNETMHEKCVPCRLKHESIHTVEVAPRGGDYLLRASFT